MYSVTSVANNFMSKKETNMEMTDLISVIGAGSWGTALAYHLSKKGYRVNLWCHDSTIARMIMEKRENSVYLPGFYLASNITPKSSLPESIEGSSVILMVTPSHAFREVFRELLPSWRDQIIISATKGIECETLMTMSQIATEAIGQKEAGKIAVLSGPSFAREVILKHPTAVVVGSSNDELGLRVQKILATPYFRIYTNSDVLGVELGGAYKNVIAIAAGVAEGLGYGHNTGAALVTRGLAEISRLGTKMGARYQTFLGLACLGDLVLTATSMSSRNRTLGYRLGCGEKLTDVLLGMKMIAEGVLTTKAIAQLGHKHNVELPIAGQVYEILFHNKEPRMAVQELMERDLKSEELLTEPRTKSQEPR